MSKKNKIITSQDQKDQSLQENKDKVFQNMYADAQIIEKPQPRPSIIPGVLAALIFGFLGGFISLVLILSGSVQHVPFLNNFDIRELFSGAPITIERTEKVTVTAVDRNIDILKHTQTMVYGIYPAKDLTLNIDGLMKSAKAPFAHAFAITSDGWLITGALLDGSMGDYVAVSRDGILYPLLALVNDRAVGIAFLRIEGNGFTVASLVRSQPLSLSNEPALTLIFEIGKNDSSHALSITGLSVPIIRNSDTLPTRIRLSTHLPSGALGAPLILLTGETVGVVSNVKNADGYAEAVPLWNFNATIDYLVKNGSLVRPRLGVHYLELSATARLTFSKIQERRSGALLVNDGDAIAVEPNSNAARAGLKGGDIITKIDGELVNGITDLATVIQSYKSDSKASISYMREGEEKIVEVTLLPTDETKKDTGEKTGTKKK